MIADLRGLATHGMLVRDPMAPAPSAGALPLDAPANAASLASGTAQPATTPWPSLAALASGKAQPTTTSWPSLAALASVPPCPQPPLVWRADDALELEPEPLTRDAPRAHRSDR